MAANAIMKHGEVATEILDLNLNHGCYNRGCHVDVTSIMSMVIVIIIRDDNTRNMFIKSVTP